MSTYNNNNNTTTTTSKNSNKNNANAGDHNKTNQAATKAANLKLSTTTTTNPTTGSGSSSSLATGVGGGGGDRVEWSRSTILGFIEDYRQQRVLWDPNTKGYHIKQTKYEALKALSHKYGAEIRSIRSKIKSLRSSFHREHGKVINGNRKGVHYQPMWFAYEAIRFILDSESQQRTPQQQQDLHIKQVVEAVAAAELGGNESGGGGSGTGSVSGTEETEEKFSANNNNNNNNSADEVEMTKAAATATTIKTANECSMNTDGTAAAAATTITTSEKALKIKTNSTRKSHMLRNAHKEADADELQPNTTEMIAITTAATTPMIPTTMAEQLTALRNCVGVGGGGGGGNGSGCLLPATAATAMTTIPANAYAAAIIDDNNNNNNNNSIVARVAAAVAAVAAAASAANNATNMMELAGVARSDFDAGDLQNYFNISADDVKTEIIESDMAEPAMPEKSTMPPCTSIAAPLAHYYMHNSNGIALSGNSRKRKTPYPAHVERRTLLNNNDDDMPMSAKQQKLQLQQQQQQQQQHYQQEHSNLNTTTNHLAATRLHDLSMSANGGDVLQSSSSVSLSPSAPSFTLASTSEHAKITQNQQTTDEYGVFGEYVAITIRKLRTSKAKIVVKHLINNLLFEAELGNYDHGMPSTKEPPQLYKM